MHSRQITEKGRLEMLSAQRAGCHALGDAGGPGLPCTPSSRQPAGKQGLAVAGRGWQGLAGAGRDWQGLAGVGRGWQGLAAAGRGWQGLAGAGSPHPAGLHLAQPAG